MLEDKKNSESSVASGSNVPQTVHIFVGGLRRPSKEQTDYSDAKDANHPAKGQAG